MATNRKQFLSVVFSFRNEEDVLHELIRRLHESLKPTGLDYEFVFVNDCSTDRSLEILYELAKEDKAIRIVNMSKRFGVTPCFLAGMEYARGDAVVTMDTDLQDPPEVIPELVEKWRDGADVVYTTRSEREGEPLIRLWVTKMVYRVLNRLSETELQVDSGMFKLMSRRVADRLLSMKEQDSYFRGLITWVGFNQVQVLYRREKRYAGERHFPLLGKGPAKEFVAGLLSFSQYPLFFIFLLGLVTSAGAFAVLAAIALGHAAGVAISFTYAWMSLLVLLAGAQLLALGILGLYLGRIYNQVKGRPLYIVESTHGFPDESGSETRF